MRIPVDLWEEIKQLAQEDERSMNGEIIWILREYAAKQAMEEKPAEKCSPTSGETL